VRFEGSLEAVKHAKNGTVCLDQSEETLFKDEVRIS